MHANTPAYTHIHTHLHIHTPTDKLPIHRRYLSVHILRVPN